MVVGWEGRIKLPSFPPRGEVVSYLVTMPFLFLGFQQLSKSKLCKSPVHGIRNGPWEGYGKPPSPFSPGRVGAREERAPLAFPSKPQILKDPHTGGVVFGFTLKSSVRV